MSSGVPIKVDATFNVLQTLDVQMATDQVLSVDLGHGSGCKVLYNTTDFWNSKPDLISKKGYIYIYSDWKKDEQERNIAGIKVGDGNAYLIDIPFTEEITTEHISDVIRHITQEEREFWNNKVRCYANDEDRSIVFTTH